MKPINTFIQHYYQQIQSNNYQQVFHKEVQEFFNNFSHYVTNTLQGLSLSNFPFYKDEDNRAIYLDYETISEYLSIQPIIHLDENDKIYNLNFALQLNLKNGFLAEEFCYLIPYDFDISQQIFIQTLYLVHYFIDNSVINNFYKYIHQLHNSLSNYIVNNTTKSEEKSSEINLTDPDKGEETFNIDKQMFLDFVDKYNIEKEELYEEELKKIIEKDKNIIFMNFSKFLSDIIIHKHYRLDKLITTLENYTSIFDSTHIDKEIHLSSHYYPYFTIRPILEYSYLKDDVSNEDMITIEFFKLNLSLYNPSNKEDKFDTTITLIPYKRDDDFNYFLDLYILLKLDKLSLFSKVEDDNIKTIDLLPFLDSMSHELIKAVDMMKNPMLKRNKEATFLDDNRDFNERDLDRYI